MSDIDTAAPAEVLAPAAPAEITLAAFAEALPAWQIARLTLHAGTEPRTAAAWADALAAALAERI